MGLPDCRHFEDADSAGGVFDGADQSVDHLDMRDQPQPPRRTPGSSTGDHSRGPQVTRSVGRAGLGPPTRLSGRLGRAQCGAFRKLGLVELFSFGGALQRSG